jgi:hypothetical protein
MSYLKFEVSIETWVTREGAPDDQWDCDSTDGSVTVTACRVAQQDGYNVLQTSDTVAVGGKVWLVWAQYSTGDSFGSDGGHYELCGVFSNLVSAEAEVARLQSVDDYSVPWNGYFENLDFIKAEEFEVLP